MSSTDGDAYAETPDECGLLPRGEVAGAVQASAAQLWAPVRSGVNRNRRTVSIFLSVRTVRESVAKQVVCC
jgi:hypothetical protein